jgi:type VI secretion system secreted protein Hcp
MRLKILLLAVLMAGASSRSSFAALNAYLYLEGETQGHIKGSVTQLGREGLIMVIAYSHIISSPRDTKSCQPSGRLNHLPLSITKEVDKSTPLLLQAFANNERMMQFRLEFWQPSSTGAEEQHYTVELRDAYIAGIHQEMLNNKYPENMTHKEREHISFSYGQLTRTWEDGGITASDDWEADCGKYVLTSDLNFDGTVNFLDISILANEWLQGPY